MIQNPLDLFNTQFSEFNLRKLFTVSAHIITKQT